MTITGKTILAASAAGILMASTAIAGPDAVGYVYTTLNGESTNMVVAFDRDADGALSNERAYSTESKGGADHTAGGDAAGDFDAEGGIDIIGDYLLNINAGGNTISVFSIDRETGDLTLDGNTPSGGARPVSITYYPKSEGSTDYWVVVGNQLNNPNVQHGGEGEDPIVFYPEEAFFADSGAHTEVSPDRNITLFSFNSMTGALSMESVLDTFDATNGGPVEVEFSPDGSKIALTTWGVAHFLTANPTNQNPGRVYVYDFNGEDGTVSNARHFQEEGVAGSIGFTWFNDSETLYVSNFNLATDKLDYSLAVLKDDGSTVSLMSNFGTGNDSEGGIDEACWVLLNNDQSKLYVSSFGGNIISEFNVADDGSINIEGSGPNTDYVSRPDSTPTGDTKDMYITSDGNTLYNIGAFQSFTISQFAIDDDGALTLVKEGFVETAVENYPGAYNFLGLIGFDK